MSIARSGSRSPVRSMQAIITKIGGRYKVTIVLSIDGQVRVLSERIVGSVDEAEEVAHRLAMSRHFPWVDVELLHH